MTINPKNVYINNLFKTSNHNNNSTEQKNKNPAVRMLPNHSMQIPNQSAEEITSEANDDTPPCTNVYTNKNRNNNLLSINQTHFSEKHLLSGRTPTLISNVKVDDCVDQSQAAYSDAAPPANRLMTTAGTGFEERPAGAKSASSSICKLASVVGRAPTGGRIWQVLRG